MATSPTYLAIARRWRPNRFEDLVGQEHVVQTLKNAIRFNRVSHGYLFSGARGVGKTSVARVFAKALRCPNAQEAVPCNTCDECLSITESRSVDVTEIDGASNNGVEAVRGIRENVAYTASSGFYKVYIIDEVHMLSLSAFNALLKTLEEPPAHVIFVFATTEVQKIPQTILSRCQRFEFRRLASQQIVDRLKVILEAEKVSVSEEGLRIIATHSDGSLRDALSLLDQVLSFSGHDLPAGGRIEEHQVVEALGVSESSSITDFILSIIDKDLKKTLSLIEEQHLAGVDLKHFTERCLEELRLLFLMRLTEQGLSPLTSTELDISSNHFQRLEAVLSKTSLIRLERMAQILSKTISQLGWSSLPRFVLEMASVRMANLENLEKVESALASGEPVGVPEVPSPSDDNETVTPVLNLAPVSPTAPVAVVSSERPAAVVQSPPSGSPDQQWKNFVDVVMKKRPLLGALLCHANFAIKVEASGKSVTISFTEGSFYERQSLESKNRSDIEELVKQFFGSSTSFQLGGSANVNRSIEAEKEAEASQLKKEALENTAVLKAKEILGADIIDVRVDV